MPRLIKKITGEFIESLNAKTKPSKLVSLYGHEDYIKVDGFVGYTQDLQNVISYEYFKTLVNYGLKTDNTIIELNISY